MVPIEGEATLTLHLKEEPISAIVFSYEHSTQYRLALRINEEGKKILIPKQ